MDLPEDGRVRRTARAVRAATRRPIGRVAKRLPVWIGQRIPRRPLWLDRRRSQLDARTLRSIQAATFRYEYDGIACIKNPFDLALYTMLLGRERPRTIVEIGSWSGGSAHWIAAQARALGLGAHVVSVDLVPVTGVSDPDVTFLEGDIYDLGSSELPTILATCARPLLVIEDGPHTYDGCRLALEFFHHHLRPGEFVVVEDGIVADLRYWALSDGPNRAVATFLAGHPGEYRIAGEYCHFYGQNVTWNTSGYLQRC